jgi:two-component system, LytTR family, sensor kinase
MAGLASTPEALGARSPTDRARTGDEGTTGAGDALPPLYRVRLTYQVLFWWTLWYGGTSWIAEYLFSLFDPAGREPFMFGLSRMVYAVYWGGAAIVAVWMTDRWPITRVREYGRIALHFAVCLMVVVAWASLAYYTSVAIVPGWKAQGLGRMLATTAKNVLFGYGVLLVLVRIVARARVHRQQEVELLRQARAASEAELPVLKMELQPHVLFNALHSISALIHSDPNAANDTLVRVSELLRHAVRTSRVQKVALRDELATLQLYTQIEELRFGERLRLTWAVDPDAMDAAVPHLLLQPLVENAIKHGLEVSSEAGQVTIGAKRIGAELHMYITNDGPGISTPSPRRGVGAGLTITRRRLQELYGERPVAPADKRAGGRGRGAHLPAVRARGSAGC